MPQIRKLWKEIEKAHRWKHLRAPSGKWLWKEKSTEAVLAFLRSTRVGCISARKVTPGEVDGAGLGDEEEGEPGPAAI